MPLAYMLEIYFDFSGYSDMAIGISRMFGFDLKPNFDQSVCGSQCTGFLAKMAYQLVKMVS